MSVPEGFVSNTLAALERINVELQEIRNSSNEQAMQRLRAELIEMFAKDRPVGARKQFDLRHCKITQWDGTPTKFRSFEFNLKELKSELPVAR